MRVRSAGFTIRRGLVGALCSEVICGAADLTLLGFPNTLAAIGALRGRVADSRAELTRLARGRG